MAPRYHWYFVVTPGSMTPVLATLSVNGLPAFARLAYGWKSHPSMSSAPTGTAAAIVAIDGTYPS